MIEYKRFISYMYIYKKGYKDANVGFVKVESKNGVCRLSVNIKVYNCGSNTSIKNPGLTTSATLDKNNILYILRY